MTAKLILAPDGRVNGTEDAEGTVVIKIFLAHKGHSPVKGNISRTVRVVGRVSDVYQAILSLSEGKNG